MAIGIIIGSLITIFGIMLKHKWLSLIGSIILAYLLFQLPFFETGIKLLISFVLFLWVLSMARRK